MKTLFKRLYSLGNKKNLTEGEIYSQGNLNIIYLVLIIICLLALTNNVVQGIYIRILSSMSFLIIFSIGLLINWIKGPKSARLFLICVGFIGVMVHSYFFGAGMDFEYLAMLFPVAALMLTDKEKYYQYSILFSFFFFLGIKTFHLYHVPLIEPASTFFQKILVGATILSMSFLILRRYKNEILKAHEKTEESLEQLQISLKALQESESRYKAIFDNAFDGILVVNINTFKPISCNQQMLTYLGIEESELQYEEIYNYLNKNATLNLEKNLEILKTEGKIRKKTRIKSKSGASMYSDITCVLLPPPNQQLTVVIFRDISTEILANKKMLEANGELKNFAHAASHDLKEPLRMIRSFGQLLQKKKQMQSDEFLGYIIDASTRMTTLIDDLLDYSTAANSAQQDRVVNMEDVLQIVLKNIHLQAVENQVIIYSNPLPKVKGNTAHLVQVFQNILSNAIKFRRTEIAPKIRINVLTNDDFHLISIRDNGIGIAPEYHAQVFGVFKRLHSKAEYEGSGIGLATCKKIVEKKGGKIWVESEPGLGTSFHFTWPVLKENNLPVKVQQNTAMAI